MSKLTVSRRQFVGTAAAVAAFHIVPRHVLGAGQTPPSGKINIAGIGVGGQGAGDIGAVAGQNIVALCDVDPRRSGDTFKKFPNAKAFTDYRKMLDAMDKSIDAVVIATPDHTHAVTAVAAMGRGKHVYCEKPLAHSIWEVREMMRVAKQAKVVTQLGNQGHSFDTIRMFCEWIWDGAIGNVHTIHAGCSAPNSALNALPRLAEKHDVPEGVDWDLWLGPAQYRPYNPVYMPGRWRSWMPFGTGTLGDWTCHVVDPVFWALDLGAPTSIVATAEDYDPKTQGETFPRRTKVKYEFAAKGKRGPVTMYWYSGYERLPRPEGLEEDRKTVDTGAIVLGDKGNIMYGSHGAGGVRIFPEEKMKAYKQPAPTLPRLHGQHHKDWLDAIKQRRKAGSDFSYGGPLTELALLGVIGTRLLGQELKWDGASGRFANNDAANALVKPEFRAGWSLTGPAAV